LIITALAFLLLACSCQSKKDPIAQLQKQLNKDGIALQKLEDNYCDRLQADFQWCDSMLRYVPEDKVDGYFDALNLAQAYLYQFNELLPVMRHDLAYIQQQLNALQNDLDTHYISDSLGMVYLHDETLSADTLHNRVLYFQDRLSSQDKELQSLKKSIRKDTSK
jgi:hypothetical protein